MCGYFSTFFKSIKLDADTNAKCINSLKLLHHRGPDDVKFVNHFNNFLGFCRLSIIDENTGSQPMFNHDQSKAILFNGEIFNYQELRDLLIAKNIKLNTNSDTEVILYLYEIYGDKLYNYLRGMFSFIIYNFENNEIYGARDRFGIKPMYYYESSDGNFLFSSEPKAIRNFFNQDTVFNKDKLSEFIVFGYSADNRSFYNKINVIKPGHSFKVKNNEIKIYKEWEPFGNHSEQIDISEKEAINKLDELFDETVKLWLTADVPVASLMSGGIDSASVTNCARNYNDIKSFSVIFPNDQDINEQENIEKIINSKNYKNSELLSFTDELVYESLNDVIKLFDAPVNDPNNMTLYALCKKIKKDYKFKVVLCGEGADELLAGYNRHFDFFQHITKTNNLNDLILGNNYLSVKRLKSIDWNLSLNFPERNNILNSLNSKNYLNKVLEYDQKTFLQSRLYCQDIMGMANSIEIRTPFLEHKLAEFINSLPVKFKHNGIYTKYLLRVISKKYLPESVSWDKKKVALNIPYSKLLKNGSLKNLFLENINKNSIISNFCNIEKLLDLFRVHSPGHSSNDHSNTLWRLLALEMWLKST